MKLKQFKFNTILILLFAAFLSVPEVTFGQKKKAQSEAIVWQTDNEALEWGPCPEFMPNGCQIAVLQGDPKNPNTDIFYKLPGNTSVARHWHHSPERMVLVSGKLQVNYDDQNPEVIETGDYAYGPAEKPHTATCLSDEPCILFIAFEDPVDAMPMDKPAQGG